jgi:hypothetical protein
MPTEDELANAPMLDDWYLYPARPGVLVLVGNVSGHPTLMDSPVTTSKVLAHDETAGWAETLNRVYRLGRKHEPKRRYLDDYIERARAEGRLVPATVSPGTMREEQPGELPPLEDAPPEPQGWKH